MYRDHSIYGRGVEGPPGKRSECVCLAEKMKERGGKEEKNEDMDKRISFMYTIDIPGQNFIERRLKQARGFCDTLYQPPLLGDMAE